MPNGHLTLEDGARAVRCGAVQSTVARIWNDKLQDVRGEVSRQDGICATEKAKSGVRRENHMVARDIRSTERTYRTRQGRIIHEDRRYTRD